MRAFKQRLPNAASLIEPRPCNLPRRAYLKIMKSDIIIPRARFSIGQMVHHRLFNYRGVVVDLDAIFREKEEFYEKLGSIKAERHAPWYRVLVHDTSAMTYVAEEHLRLDVSREAGKPFWRV